jgi:hypothetical protein
MNSAKPPPPPPHRPGTSRPPPPPPLRTSKPPAVPAVAQTAHATGREPSQAHATANAPSQAPSQPPSHAPSQAPSQAPSHAPPVASVPPASAAPAGPAHAVAPPVVQPGQETRLRVSVKLSVRDPNLLIARPLREGEAPPPGTRAAVLVLVEPEPSNGGSST